jgi:nitrite reductase (NO-forming)
MEEPSYVTFNGRTDALSGDNALQMKVGERARIYMVNEGLSLDSNWHPIGSHWDTVYPEAATHPDNDVIRGSQSTLVVTGGGTVTELVGQVPSTVILVDHALPRTFDKGAIGEVVIEGDPNEEIFGVGDAPEGDSGSGDAEATSSSTTTTEPSTTTTESSGGDEAVATDEVTIIDGAFDPDNADEAYTPPVITVEAGTTVTWTNEDAIVHTVTSGTASDTAGTFDGTFDSGDMAEGDTFSFTFDEPGEFPYFCIPHPWMQGTVIVTA